jgi:hypothetical protein
MSETDPWVAAAIHWREGAVARLRTPPGLARSGLWCALAAAGATAVLLAACSSSPTASNSSATAAHTASLLAGGRTTATLDVLTGTTTLTIDVAKFGPGGPLLRVSTPAGDPAPQLRVLDTNGTAQPAQGSPVDLSANNASAVTVTLNAAVSWQLDLGGGSSRTDADLRGGQVSGIVFSAGSSVISLALPQPHGLVPISLAGGASQFLLSLPAGVPAQVTAGGGASEVSLEGQNHVGVAGGSVFTTPGWAANTAGFDIDATAGASRITVTARAS